MKLMFVIIRDNDSDVVLSKRSSKTIIGLPVWQVPAVFYDTAMLR